MTTQKQIIANRQNALKSTGPKTAHGKAIAAINALKHGIYAKKKQCLLPDESISRFNKFRKSLLSSFEPRDTVQQIYIEQIIITLWRMQRIMRLETETLAADLHKYVDGLITSNYGCPELLGVLPPFWLVNAMDTQSGLMEKIARYEAHLNKILSKYLKLLENHQDKKEFYFYHLTNNQVCISSEKQPDQSKQAAMLPPNNT